VTKGDGQVSLSLVAKPSSVVGVYFILVGTSERLPIWTTRDVWSEIIHESSVESMWCVDQIFSCMVYIDLNCRDSQI
jgi:hypothetical protein